MNKTNFILGILGLINGILIIIYLIIILSVDKERQNIAYEKNFENPKIVAAMGFVKSINNDILEVVGIEDNSIKYQSVNAVIEANTKIKKDNVKTTDKIQINDLVEVYLKKQLVTKDKLQAKADTINIISDKNNKYNSYLTKVAFYYLDEEMRSNLALKPSIIPFMSEQSYIIKDKKNKEINIKKIDVYKVVYKDRNDPDKRVNIFIRKVDKEVLGTTIE